MRFMLFLCCKSLDIAIWIFWLGNEYLFQNNLWQIRFMGKPNVQFKPHEWVLFHMI